MSKRSRKARRRDGRLRQKAEAEAKAPVSRGPYSPKKYQVAPIGVVRYPFATRSW
jgi:hypothetical protein